MGAKDKDGPADPQRWTQEGFLAEVRDINSQMKDRNFAFILGAGASRNSGIRSGSELAREWASQWHVRECHDGTGIDAWIAARIGQSDFTMAEAGRFYPQIFDGRFRRDPDSGYAALEKEMEDKEPSVGYSLLAEILQNTRHKVVVSTNFDNLVADALAIHAHQHPMVVGHETLAGFIRPRLRRPLVAKIHRDLFFDPINDSQGTGKMKDGWAHALHGLFQSHTPLVLGYGGNDGSLMGLLADMKTGSISGGMFWCHHQDDEPNQTIRDVVARHNGVLVAIEDFDFIMMLLAKALIPDLAIDRIATKVRDLGGQRADKYHAQFQDLAAKARAMEGSKAARSVQTAIQESLRDSEDWWNWQMRIDAESDPDKQELMYREGIKRFSHFGRKSNLAWFLETVRGDFDEAEKFYRIVALEAPDNAFALGNFGLFMHSVRGEIDEAERLLRAALDLDGDNPNYLGSIAVIKWVERRELNEAERLFRASEATSPGHATNLGNFANFMYVERGEMAEAERLYRLALEAEPRNANVLGNFARLLIATNREGEAAERIDSAMAYSAKADDVLCLECWFYRYAVFPQWREEAGAELERLLRAGVSSPGWDLSGVVRRAKELGHPAPERLDALAAAIWRPKGEALPEGLV